MTDLPSIKEKLDALAIKMLEKAADDSTPLPQKLDTFKFVQQYYLGAEKLKANIPPGDFSTPTMSELRERVATGASAEPEEDDADE